MSKLNK